MAKVWSEEPTIMPSPPLVPPSSVKERARGWLLGGPAAALLFSTLIVFNVLQTATLLVKPFSQKAFRRLNRGMARLWWGWCALGAEKIYHVRFVMSGDDVPPEENAIVVLNHQDMADITVMFSFARAKRRVGDLKWFVKDVIKYVPGVGWGMLFLDCLYIKRDWTEDRNLIRKVFEKILKYDVPIWLMLFAEGTRLRPQKLEQSRRYALGQGRAPLRHVLFPRTKGFAATVISLRGHLDAVYDVTIGYPQGVPTLWQWIRGYAREVHVHVRRFGMDRMPGREEDLSEWLVQRFEEKDVLLDGFYRTGSFPRPIAS
ncbi:MAG: lysophospholipid acyltransferase family protein [bacterium]